MDYEKEYKDAMERAKKWGLTHKLCIEDIFPELAESEDERIREEMIRYFTEMKKGGSASLPYDSCITYLEKQKDLDKMIVVSPEVWDKAIADAYENGKKEGEKQKEQKPAEKQDYSNLNDLEKAIHRGFLAAGVENVPVTIIKETAKDCLAQINLAGWSEEDKKREEMKIKFRITEPFFITPVLAIYQGIQIAWLWFEVDFIIRK